ncbi:hypothetical protein GCM10025774_06520 [Microbacterium kyungheense]|uniref:DoxX-like protein n=1 Tax=Microbacterium kyungheense TaxID=1263636 RepID=A0A543EUN2_9MICO|nr:hypothetical protein FB391_2745 [Microbacterium kyungheense]
MRPVDRLTGAPATAAAFLEKGPPALITLSWLLLIALVGGILALIDGILRVRGKGNTIVGIIEIVVAALFVLSLFLPGIPFGSLVLAIATLIVVVIGIVFRGRQGVGIAIAALAVIALWIVLVNHWLVIPGIN